MSLPRGTKIVAPLSVAALVLTLTGCVNDVRNPNEMSEAVQTNIKETMKELSTLVSDEEFMGQIFIAGTGQNMDFKGSEDKLDKVDELVADDEHLNVMKEHAQNTLGTINDLNDEQAKDLANTAPLALFGYTFGQPNTTAAEIVLDPSGFENRDGAWVLTKHGALALKDDLGRYTSLLALENRIAFTEDGSAMTLKSLRESTEREKSELYGEVYKASETAWAWLGENEAEDFGKSVNENKGEILEGMDLREGTTIEFGVSEDNGFTVTGTNGEESIVYSSDNGLIRTKAETEAESTIAKQLFDEFNESYMEVMWQAGGPDVSEVADSLHDNGIVDEAQWSVKQADGEDYPVATINGEEFAFAVPDYAIGSDDDYTSEETPAESPSPSTSPTSEPTASETATPLPTPTGRDLDANPEDAVDDPSQVPSQEPTQEPTQSSSPSPTEPEEAFPTELPEPTNSSQPGN